jgi:hypothetical protein
LTFDIALSILAFFADVIFEREAASSRPVLATIFAKKKIVQANGTIIVPNVIGMGSGTGLFFPSEIETERFSALLAEFEEVLVQDCATDLTVTVLHTL